MLSLCKRLLRMSPCVEFIPTSHALQEPHPTRVVVDHLVHSAGRAGDADQGGRGEEVKDRGEEFLIVDVLVRDRDGLVDLIERVCAPAGRTGLDSSNWAIFRDARMSLRGRGLGPRLGSCGFMGGAIIDVFRGCLELVVEYGCYLCREESGCGEVFCRGHGHGDGLSDG